MKTSDLKFKSGTGAITMTSDDMSDEEANAASKVAVRREKLRGVAPYLSAIGDFIRQDQKRATAKQAKDADKPSSIELARDAYQKSLRGSGVS
jgi:hypothetical protein